MIIKPILKSFPALLLILMRFNPVGTWAYTSPGVAEGYTTGEFNKDEFTGTVSYSEGVFDLTATRKLSGSEE